MAQEGLACRCVATGLEELPQRGLVDPRPLERHGLTQAPRRPLSRRNVQIDDSLQLSWTNQVGVAIMANVRANGTLVIKASFAEVNVHADARRPVNSGIARGIPFKIESLLTR